MPRRPSIKARGEELVSFAEKLRDAGFNWVQANNALYGPGGKYTELFVAAGDRTKFSGSPADKRLTAILESLPASTEPVSTASASGKLNVRMPKSVHAALASEAVREGVSLNHLIVSKLSLQLQAAVRE